MHGFIVTNVNFEHVEFFHQNIKYTRLPDFKAGVFSAFFFMLLTDAINSTAYIRFYFYHIFITLTQVCINLD